MRVQLFQNLLSLTEENEKGKKFQAIECQKYRNMYQFKKSGSNVLLGRIFTPHEMVPNKIVIHECQKLNLKSRLYSKINMKNCP